MTRKKWGKKKQLEDEGERESWAQEAEHYKLKSVVDELLCIDLSMSQLNGKLLQHV